jgi:hypothetical protein
MFISYNFFCALFLVLAQWCLGCGDRLMVVFSWWARWNCLTKFTHCFVLLLILFLYFLTFYFFEKKTPNYKFYRERRKTIFIRPFSSSRGFIFRPLSVTAIFLIFHPIFVIHSDGSVWSPETRFVIHSRTYRENMTCISVHCQSLYH